MLTFYYINFSPRSIIEDGYLDEVEVVREKKKKRTATPGDHYDVETPSKWKSIEDTPVGSFADIQTPVTRFDSDDEEFSKNKLEKNNEQSQDSDLGPVRNSTHGQDQTDDLSPIRRRETLREATIDIPEPEIVKSVPKTSYKSNDQLKILQLEREAEEQKQFEQKIKKMSRG